MISDIASLQHYLLKNADQPEAGRYKVVAFISRMLNMHEKLGQAVTFLGKESQEHFQAALDSLLRVLAVKVEEMGPRLKAMGQPAIEESEISNCHTLIFAPIQNQADHLMAGFVTEKVKRMLDGYL